MSDWMQAVRDRVRSLWTWLWCGVVIITVEGGRVSVRTAKG